MSLDEVTDGIGSGDDILIVDDDPSSHVALEAVLASLGRKLVSVSSGREALAKLLDQDFALILLDLNMPDLDGLETARLIRARERNRETPIVFVTGATGDEAMEDAYAAGGFEFLLKPVRPQVLLAKVRLYFSLQERTRALQRTVEELRESQTKMRDEERKRIEAESSESRFRLLSEQQAERHAFIAVLSHELRNPLHGLQLAFDVLLHSAEGIDEHVRTTIVRRLQQTSRLVSDLLEVSRLTGGDFEISREVVDLFELTRHAIEDCEPTLERNQTSIVLQPSHAPRSVTVAGDPVRLLQALTNVIDNAARYAPAGTVRVDVLVDDDHAVVRVTDTGRGMSNEQMQHIFDVVAPARVKTDGSGGLGLGLALARRIIELHHGRLTAASEGLDKGSTFEIRLPLTGNLPAKPE